MALPTTWMSPQAGILIDEAIQIGRGVAAQVFPARYNVFRLGATTSGSILSQPPLYTNFPGRIRRSTSKQAIEDEIFALLCFNATLDNRYLQLGDVLTEVGYEAQSNNVYYVAQFRPTRETLLMRVENSAILTRPMPTAGQAAQLPTTGFVEVQGYGGYEKSTEQVLTLQNGLYGYSSLGSAEPASLQVGIQQKPRLRDGTEPGWPTRPYREEFLMCIPPTPGEELNEKDVINAGNGDRYVIGSIIQSADAGLAGWICVGERKAT